MNEPLSPDDPSITLPTLDPAPVPKRLEQVNTPIPDREKMRAARKRNAGCAIVVLAAFMCLACLFCGGFGYAYFQELGWLPRTLQRNDASLLGVNLQKDKICEAVRVDVCRNFTGISLVCPQDGLVDGVVTAKRPVAVHMSGAYVVTYGIVASSINVWESYPMTSEIQISVPMLKVTGVQVLPGRITDADGVDVANWTSEERTALTNDAKKQLYEKAVSEMEGDPTIRKRCVEYLKTLLAAFGINLVLVEDGPGVS